MCFCDCIQVCVIVCVCACMLAQLLSTTYPQAEYLPLLEINEANVCVCVCVCVVIILVDFYDHYNIIMVNVFAGYEEGLEPVHERGHQHLRNNIIIL